ncbi:hypothetical protein [Cohnella sp. GCM10012308]|uniref:hypothetical protein n=1 Tax=Cohnella sp. GCM10012308 TaxID=3317329 RepID=UPI00361CAFAA
MKLEDFLYYLSIAKSPSDIVLAWSTMGSAVRNSKAVITLENYERSTFSQNAVKTLYLDNNDFIPYFQSPYFYFVDDDILKNMFSTRNNVEIPVDYSIMFDTNYASYIHLFVNNNTGDLKNEVFQSIATLLRDNYQYDFNFYLIENSKKIDLDINWDIITFIKQNKAIFTNIVSLQLFKNIDTELFRTKGRINYTITYEEAEQEAKVVISDLFCTEQGKEYLLSFAFIQKQMTLFLIGMLTIHFSSNRNASKKMLDLFQFMDQKMGTFFDRESIIAHKFFKKQSDIIIFNKIQKKGDTKNLFETINNIAWDFITPRTMELVMRYGGEGKFFIPFLLSHDIGLKQVLQLFSIKGCFFDNSMKVIPIPQQNTNEYYESENCKLDLTSYFSEENKSTRAKRLEKNRQEINEILIEEFEKLVEAVTNH